MNTSFLKRALAAAAILSAAGVSSCSDAQPETPEAKGDVSASQAATAARLLKSGDPSTCNAPAVTANVVKLIGEAWAPRDWTDAERLDFLEVATMQLSNVTAVEVEAAVPLIVCEATFRASEGVGAWEARIGYGLTLQLDTNLVNVEVDLQPGVDVLQTTSRQFERDIVEVRRSRGRDDQAKEVCGNYMQHRGQWSLPELDAFISDMGEVYRRNGLSLGTAGDACDRLIRADREAAFTAARLAHSEQERRTQETRVAATEARKQGRENRIEYTGPPVSSGSPSVSPSPAPTRAD